MYEAIVSDTIKTIRELPMPIPAAGGIAGPSGETVLPWNRRAANDNAHYPMGRTYYKLGVSGVAKKAAAQAARGIGYPGLLEGIAAVYTEIAAYLARYAVVMEEAAGEDARLLRITANLKALSERAPVHFDEAVQLSYLMWKLRGGDIGRLDVHLQSYFENDIASGYITEDEALALICRYWELLNENGSGDTLVNVMVGGRNPDGTDAGSRLSVLMLRATKIVAKSEPHIAVRVHANLSEEIRREMLDVQLMGQGQGTQFNDEIVIPGLMAFGIPEELACTYTNDGCNETVFDGHSTIQFNHIDAVAVFELAFNNGDWAERTYREKNKYWTHRGGANFSVPDAVTGFASGRIEDCATFEEFYAQYLAQYKFQVRHCACDLRRTYLDRMAGVETSVLLNGTFEEVLETGLDIHRGALPFENYMNFAGSIPTVADCLVAVKQLIFEQNRYTVAEVKEAIRVNFEGYESMRRAMLACPKFGNDIDEVDLIAADIANHYCDWLAEYREETGFAILPALYGWRFVDEAYGIAATPDGRHYKDPIAEHYCATPGRAKSGPTAIIRSVAKAGSALFRAVGCSPVHITLPRNLGTPEESRSIVGAIYGAAMDSGLGHLNIGIYDVEQLREAQRDPANHEDVIVRVWGYSARFVDLCTEMQEHVISRILTEGA